MLTKEEFRDQPIREPRGVQHILGMLSSVVERAFHAYQRVRVVVILDNGHDLHIKFSERFLPGAVPLYRHVKELIAVAYTKAGNHHILGNERIEVGEVTLRYHLINQLPQYVLVAGVCQCGACNGGCECGYESGAPVHGGPFSKGGY